jgi:hypothetical protein
VFSGISTVHKLSNLTSGFAYYFKISAVNEAGEGADSVVGGGFVTAEVPSIPATGILSLINRSDSMIHFSWLASEDNGGLPILGYKIFMSE